MLDVLNVLDMRDGVAAFLGAAQKWLFAASALTPTKEDMLDLRTVGVCQLAPTLFTIRLSDSL